MDCVAEVIYHEARGEGENGMRAVAHVIYNRAKKSGESPCVVVRKPNQFAYKGTIKRNSQSWKTAKRIAAKPGSDLTRGATFFHNLTVRPSWSYRFRVTYRWRNHIFYAK